MNDRELEAMAQATVYNFNGTHLRRPVYIEVADYSNAKWMNEVHCGTDVVSITTNVMRKSVRVHKSARKHTVHFRAYLATKDGEPMANACAYQFGMSVHETEDGDCFITFVWDPTGSIRNKNIRGLFEYLRDVCRHNNEQIRTRRLTSQSV